MSYNFQRMLASQLRRINVSETAVWAFPLTLGAGWFLWPALDYEWKMEMGLAPDPEAAINKVHNAKLARMEALKIAKHGPDHAVKLAAAEKEEEEESADDEEGEEEAAADGDDDAPAAEDGDDDADADADAGEEESEEDEDDAEEIKFKPLYIPTKAEKLGPQEVWDNFTIKALNMSEDDDDEEDEEEEEEEEEDNEE